MIGIDEVGRGAWAGPLLVVGARIKRAGKQQVSCRDSKLYTKVQRLGLLPEIVKHYEFGEGWVSSLEIDNLGLSNAMRLGVRRALCELDASYQEEIIIDGNINYCQQKYLRARCLIKADNLVNEVSVASIYAKVLRDRYMAKLSPSYQKYGFRTNVGYGTALHRLAIARYGVTDIHRRSFAPIKAVLDE